MGVRTPSHQAPADGRNRRHGWGGGLVTCLVLAMASLLLVKWPALATAGWSAITSTTSGTFVGGATMLAIGAVHSGRGSARKHAKLRGHNEGRPLPRWRIALILTGGATVTAVMLIWLAGLVTQPAIPSGWVPHARWEALLAAVTFGLSITGAVVLVLVFRKQWLDEHVEQLSDEGREGNPLRDQPGT